SLVPPPDLPPPAFFDQNHPHPSRLALMLDDAPLAHGCRRPAPLCQPLVIPGGWIPAHPLHCRVKRGGGFLGNHQPNDVLSSIDIRGELTSRRTCHEDLASLGNGLHTANKVVGDRGATA